MRSKLLMPPLLLAFSAAPGASSDPQQWIPRCGGPFQLCGYIERDSGEERTPQRFEVANRFSDGLAAVRIDGRYGYIDPTGRVLIAPQFEAAGPFTGDYAEVRVDGRSGAIDRSGRIVVPAQFDRLVPFAGGAFLATPLRSEAPPNLEPRLDGLSKLALLSGNGSAGLYHVSKGWLTLADLRFSFFDEPSRGLIWAGKRNEHHDDQWGLLRSDGTWQVTPRYNHVQWINETHAVVGSMPDYSLHPRDRRKAVLRGAVDRDGKLAVPLEPRGLSYWRGGYGYASEPMRQSQTPLAFDREARKGIVLGDGALLGGRWFDEVDIREDGKLPRGRIGNTWLSIERDGRLVPDQLEGTAFVECDSGLKFIHRGDMVEVHRPGDGKVTGRFEKGILRQVECPGPFSAKRNGKWFIILEDGSVLGGQTGFDNMYGFSVQYAAVQVGDKWGIIDRSGAFTVKPKFRKLRPGAKDKFVVGEGKKAAWINGKGAWIKALVFKRPAPAQALTCEGGLRFFTIGGLWGLQGGDGKTVIEPRYRALSCFNQGVSWTAAPGDDGWCPIGPEGRRRDAIRCRKRFYPVTVTHHFPEKFSDDPYESSVLWARAWLDYHAGNRDEPPKWISDDEGPPSYSVLPGQASDR